MLLADAKDVRVGTTQAKAVYGGAVKIWPSFDPTRISGLMVWLDADGLAPITTAWPDKSGTGHHGTIVGTPAPAVRANALNGKSVVRFKYQEGRVRGNNGLVPVVGTYNNTVVYVTRLWGPNVGRAFTTVYPPANYLVGFHSSGQDCMYDNAWVANTSPWAGSPGPWKLYGADSFHDGTNYTSHFYKDGALLGTLASGGAGMGTNYNLSGYSDTGDLETCDIEVAELVIYNRRLADPERQQIEAYLKGKWGL